MRIFALAAALAASVVFAPPFATAVIAEEAPRTLTVSGEGAVSAIPDMARISLGARAQAETAAEAMNLTSEALDAILARLEALGIEARDVQTGSLRLDQRWSHGSVSGARKFEGYEASNILNVRVRDLARLSEVLQAVLDDGANSFSGLSFDLGDPKPMQDEARRAAVRDAMGKAALYAEAAGVTLGPVLSITDSASPMAPSFAAPVMMAEARAVPVAAGELTLTGGVTMVFEISD